MEPIRGVFLFYPHPVFSAGIGAKYLFFPTAKVYAKVGGRSFSDEKGTFISAGGICSGGRHPREYRKEFRRHCRK